MGRRRKNNDFAFAETLAGLVGLMVLGWIFSPRFRFLIFALLLLFALIILLVIAIWFARKAFEPESPYSIRKFSTETSTIEEEIPNEAELTTSEKLRKLDWFQFEKLIEQIYWHRGFSVQRLGGAHPDGGVDLIVESSTEKFVVQCKHWRKWHVGVRQIREFLGTLTDTKIQKGIFITLTGYSGDAKALADKHGIQILNESDIIEMLNEDGLIYSLEVSTLFNDTRKSCPKCGSELVLREARTTGNQFWGCSTYPRCKFTMKFDSE